METTTVPQPPVFQQRTRWEHSHRVNVGSPGRIASAIAGGLLAAYGIERRGKLGYALAGLGGLLAFRGATGHCMVMGPLGLSTAGDDRLQFAPKHGEAARPDHARAIHVRDQITIQRPVEEVYLFWRELSNLPRVMQHLISVEPMGDRRSHWKTRAPAGATVEWDAIIESDVPMELIAWESVSPAAIPNGGSVRFRPAPGGRGTELSVALHYQPPAGRLGQWTAKLAGLEPAQQLREDLRQLKQLLEAGEIATNEGQPHGRR